LIEESLHICGHSVQSEWKRAATLEGCSIPVRLTLSHNALSRAMNATLPIDSTPVSDLPTVYKTYSGTDFVIGLFICLGACHACYATDAAELKRSNCRSISRKRCWSQHHETRPCTQRAHTSEPKAERLASSALARRIGTVHHQSARREHPCS
jgi:hypothetical protein